MKKLSFPFFIASFLLAAFLLSGPGHAKSAASLTAAEPSMIPGKMVYIRHDPNGTPGTYVAPPASFYQTAVQTADIQINYIGSWPAAAQNAFTYAASIWETQISSTVPIVIEAEFSSSLPSGILGGAGPETFYRSVSFPYSNNTWYPVALANALSNVDNNGSSPEISAIFSSSYPWYYGTDGNPPTNQFDFVTVVLHEIGHGLGFSGSFAVSNGVASWGYGTSYPFIYDRFVKNGSGTSIVSGFANNSTALTNQLSSNNIYFDGPFTNLTNGSPAKLFAPNPFQSGSSIAHLDEIFNGTGSSLMTYSVSPGEATHNPGSVSLAIFRDMGWSLAVNTPPTLLNLPAVLIQTGSSQNNAIDLWLYTFDTSDDDDELAFEIVSQSNPTAGVTLDSNRYIDVNPTNPSWTGSSTITIRVTDSGSLTAQKSFQVVSGEITNTYLPMTLR